MEEKNRILDPDTLTFTPGVGYSYVYTGESTLYFDITCTVSNDQGDPMGALGEKVILNYKQGNKQNALSEILTWNADKGRYEGTFNNFEAKFGLFQFSQLVIEDENSISYITKGTAHAITSIPAASMEYVGNDLPENGLVFDLSGASARTVSLKLANASAATLKLTLTNAEGNRTVLDSSDESVCQISADTAENTVFTFTMPGDGEWTITDVKAGMVFYNDVFYDGSDAEGATGWLDMTGGETPIIPADELPTTEFVTEVNIVVPRGEIDLGSGSIGTTFSLGADEQIKLSFEAYNGEDIVAYAQRAGKTITVSTSKGSYVRSQSVNMDVTGGTINNVLVEGSATLTESAPALTLTVGSFPADGIYKLLDALEVQFKVSDAVNGAVIDTLNTEVSTLPSIKAAWNKPVVTVTGISPAPGTVKRVYTVKEPTTSAQAITGDFFSFEEFKATVYIHTPVQGGGWFDQEAAEAYAPQVTLGLTGVPSGTAATMVFNTRNSDSVGSTFKFENGSATAVIGKAVNGVRGWSGVDDYPECYPAGTMTQNVITFTYNNVTYKTALDNAITIDQPQSPSALNFVGIPETYTGTRPAQVVGKGTSVTVTLPELAWAARIEEPKDGTWSAYTNVGEVTDVNGNPTKAYSYNSWEVEAGCSGKVAHYRYQYFTWTKFESSITAQTDIYTQNKKIAQWVINGKTYNAGETVTVTGDGIINATAVVVNAGDKIFVETLEQTTYKYLYGYVAEAVVQDSTDAPNFSYNLIGTMGTTQNAALAQPKLADISKANAATNTPGTNTTTDVALYSNYWK